VVHNKIILLVLYNI